MQPCTCSSIRTWKTMFCVYRNHGSEKSGPDEMIENELVSQFWEGLQMRNGRCITPPLLTNGLKS